MDAGLLGPGGRADPGRQPTCPSTCTNEVQVWDIRDRRRPQRTALLLGHSDGVDSVAFAADGGTVVSGSVDGTVRVWALTSDAARARESLALGGHDGPVMSVTALADGRVASAGLDGTVRLWSLDLSAVIGDVCGATSGPLGTARALVYQRSSAH